MAQHSPFLELREFENRHLEKRRLFPRFWHLQNPLFRRGAKKRFFTYEKKKDEGAACQLTYALIGKNRLSRTPFTPIFLVASSPLYGRLKFLLLRNEACC